MTGGLIAGYASSKSNLSNCYTIKPAENTVSNDVGRGKTGTVTYGVSADKYNNISNFKRLGSDWCIVNGAPALKSLKKYVDSIPLYEIKGERLIDISTDQNTWEEDEESVDYGYDEFGDVLE